MTPAPTPVERTPNRRRRSFTCLHCGTYASHEWHALGYMVEYYDEPPSFRLAEPEPAPAEGPDAWAESRWDTATDAWGSEPSTPWIIDATWAQSVCNACPRVTTWRQEVVIYPQASPVPFPHEDMPEAVVPLYNEARSIVNLSRRAAAALARATMEQLLRLLDPDAPTSARLDDRILRIEDRVSSSLAQLLTFIRHVGNQSLHGTGVPDDAVIMVLDTGNSEPVEAIFHAINELVDELKTKPERNRRLAAMVPEGVLETVDRKRRARSVDAAASGGDDGAGVDPTGEDAERS